MDAIVLDGEQRSALAVTRSLGRKGIHVTVGAEKNPSLSSSSRYCSNAFSYPSPYGDPVGFMQALSERAKASGNSILFPMTDVTLTEVLTNREKLPKNIIIPYVERDKYINLTDKIKLFQLARKLDIHIPATFISTDYENLDCLIREVTASGFPVVVKPNYSKIRTDKGWVNAAVHYAMDESKLRDVLSKDIFCFFPFLVQKKVEGPGVGIFLLMDNGEVVAEFAHKRLREKPPSGGVSVLCESIDPPVGALQDAVKILKAVLWTGVAMVEFKIDREQNISRLLEVNARFWGSLQLAITSGVDFPYLLFRMAMGDKLGSIDRYKIGVKSRWELGDLDHLLIRIFKKSSRLNLPLQHPGIATLMKDFLFDFFRPSVNNEVLQADDVLPFAHEIRCYMRHLLT